MEPSGGNGLGGVWLLLNQKGTGLLGRGGSSRGGGGGGGEAEGRHEGRDR